MALVRFADTSFWYAFHVREDRHHPDAAALWATHGHRLLVTNHIVGETWTLLRRKISHKSAVAVVGGMQRSHRVQVLHVDPATEQEAWTWLRRHDERKYSFVDATSFAVMRQRRIHEALAFDGDFAAAGFVEVRP
ncbi:MAG: type II toxin-antitoxin system VapC family toxin [Acidimicrobiales bacterium]